MNYFDKMLYEISVEAAQQSPKTIQKITPWNKMFKYFIWGMMILLFEVFLYYNEWISFISSSARPLIGCILIIKGLSMCQSDNKYFKRAFVASCGYFIYLSSIAVILALPLHQRIPKTISAFTFIEPLFYVLIMYNLSKALQSMVSDESAKDVKRNFSDIIMLIVSMQFIMLIIYYLQMNNILTNSGTLIVLALYICVIIKFIDIGDILVGQGYSIKGVKKRNRYLTNIFIICDLIITIILIIFFINHYSSLQETIHKIDIEAEMLATGVSETEIDEVKERLISMGMDKYIAEDLLPEDIMKFKDVKQLLKTSMEQELEFAGARLCITCYVGELNYNEDKNDTNGYVDELLYYFEWIDKPKHPYAERLLELPYDSYYVDCSIEPSRWIHIADVNEERIYYLNNNQDSNKESLQNTAILLKNAEKYRSYIVHKLYNTGKFNELNLAFGYVKEQKSYPYESIYDEIPDNNLRFFTYIPNSYKVPFGNLRDLLSNPTDNWNSIYLSVYLARNVENDDDLSKKTEHSLEIDCVETE